MLKPTKLSTTLLLLWFTALMAAGVEVAVGQIAAGPHGHLVRHGDQLLVLIGASGTHCA